jgi:hypothetical protein
VLLPRFGGGPAGVSAAEAGTAFIAEADASGAAIVGVPFGIPFCAAAKPVVLNSTATTTADFTQSSSAPSRRALPLFRL